MQVALINLAVFLSSLGLGVLYTLACLYYPAWRTKKLYDQRVASFQLRKNMHLITGNLALLCLINLVGISYFEPFFINHTPSLTLFITQFIVIALLDDFFFYFWHRLLHSHPWLMRHIHGLHHRARVPYPIEFIYAHPVEWLGGMTGLVLAVILLISYYSGINATVVWAYTAYRTLRELNIHSNVEPRWMKYLPFLCNAKHHALHHNRVRGNFASAFTYLDDCFGTRLQDQQSVPDRFCQRHL